MKKNKILLAATVVLLAVGTSFGASKLHKKFAATWYTATGVSCTSIPGGCSANSANAACATGTSILYFSDAGCTTPSPDKYKP
jgi:hypothetical protein